MDGTGGVGGWLDHADDAPWTVAREMIRSDGATLDAPVLVTAFGPFPGQPVNPSELVVDELAGEEDVVCHVLDVSYRRAPEQLDAMVRMVDPVAVVCFGVAASAGAVRVEEVARRHDTSDQPDVDGEIREGEAIDTGPDTIATRLDVDAIRATLGAAGIVTERSSDAGGYVCNHLFRHAVTSHALSDRPVGFVHVPQFGSPGFDPGRFGVIGRLVVASVIDRVLRRAA